MPALSSYLNVENTALVILRNKGFRVWTDEGQSHWFAERDRWDFMADSPTELLGLAAIYEFHHPQQFQEYWWRIEEPSLLDSTPTQPPDYRPIHAAHD
jgi:hypothetical protein